MIEPKYKWKIKYENSNDIINKLLIARGISDKELFLNGTLDCLKPPSTFSSMSISVNRILEAISNSEKICVYGDYDADGITSTAILYSFLKDIGAVVSYYIPNRLDEGYGMNSDAIKKISSTCVKLIITVDNGIASIDEIGMANELGMDVIVTDHHEIQEKLPTAFSIINPKLTDEPINIAGVTVAYKLIMGIKEELHKRDKNYKVDRDEYLDFVTIGTISDIMILQAENRIIVKYGLPLVKNTKNIGLIELMKISGIYDKPNLLVSDIGFIIAPKLNAAGRLGNAEIALELLLEKEEDKAKILAKKLCDMNLERQKQEQEILNDILSVEINEDDNIIVEKSDNWNSGIIGIVAAKLSEKYYKPVVLLCEDEDKLSGSARSIPGVNIFELISSCKEYLIRFGGHDGASGLSLSKDKFESFKNQILKEAKKLDKQLFIPSIDVDVSLNMNEITVDFINNLDILKPFGMGNSEPIFKICGKVKSVDLIGKSKNHLKIKLSNNNVDLDLVGFNKVLYYPNLIPGKEIEVIGTVSINEFNNNLTAQMQILDMKSLDLEILDVKNNYSKFKNDLNEKNLENEKYITREKIADIFRHLKYLEKLNKENTNIFHMHNNLKDINLCELLMSLEILKELDIIEYDMDNKKHELNFKILNNKNELYNSKLYQRYSV